MRRPTPGLPGRLTVCFISPVTATATSPPGRPIAIIIVIVEYKWGKRTDGGKFVRNSGILLHATGPDGGAQGMWMSSIECQLAQGCVGDLIVIRGKDAKGETIPVRLTSPVVLGPDKRPRWRARGEPRVFTGDRQLWWSRHDPDFQELLDTRGKNDVESPIGEWTRVECLCEADRLTIRVNGHRSTPPRTSPPQPGRSCYNPRGSSCSFAGSSCTR